MYACHDFVVSNVYETCVDMCMRQLSEYQELWCKYIQENIKHIHEMSDLDMDKAISNTLVTDLKIGIIGCGL